jgi:DNA-binding SARP family transcriptional activator
MPQPSDCVCLYFAEKVCMSELRIHLFGFPRLVVDGHLRSVERRKSLALAAYLAIESSAGVSNQARGERIAAGCGRETLAAIFWPEASQQQAGAYLRQALWELNRSIGDGWVVKEGQTLRLDSRQNIWVDVNHFETALENWKAGITQDEAAIQWLVQACSLYSGDFLAGLTLRDSPAFDEWQTAHTELLRLHMVQTLEALIDFHSRRQKWDGVLDCGRRWLELDPSNEAAHRAVMQAYFQTGQRSAALKQYQRCRHLLNSELGVRPEAETEELSEIIKKSPHLAVRPEPRLPPAAPTGTVTFLFTDIESSTRLWQSFPNAMRRAFAQHEAIIRQTMLEHGGYVYKMVGDAFQVAFSTAQDALEAAVDAQRRLHAEPWEELGQLKVRMALHTGIAEERGNDYVGPELNRVARIIGTGYGGQVLLNQTTYELVRGYLPSEVSLVDLGEQRLRDLEQAEHIYQVQATGLPSEFPPLKTTDHLVCRLPVMATPFVGRQHELEQIEALLADPGCRLITLVGIGGTGKTRLAIQAASLAQATYQNICFVSLAASHSLDEMVLTIAQVLDFKFQTVQYASTSLYQGQLFQFLAGRKVLLVLDNFEQLVNFSGFIVDLLQAAPKIKLIVTSRERLNLPGEWVMEVLGLAFPSDMWAKGALEYPAVQLFLANAQRISNTRLTPDDQPAILRICQILEGVPLGIEMAASWVKLLSCAEIAAEIEKDLDFLSTSWRGMPERHRTLRAIFDHSWRLLADRERDGFIRLAVFKGGFTRQAAWEVAGVPILLLAGLTDKSFLRRVSDGRYEIHPVLSGYVCQKLVADSALMREVEERHSRYFSVWSLEMVEDLRGPQQLIALGALRSESHNLQAALQTLVHLRAFELLEQVLPGLVLFSAINDQLIFTNELESILSQLQEVLFSEHYHPALQTLVLSILRYYSSLHSNSKREYFEKLSLELLTTLPDSRLKAYALLLNCIGPTMNSFPQTLALGQDCMRIFSKIGEAWEIALIQLVLGDIYNFGKGDPVQACEYYQTACQAFTSQGNQWGVSLCFNGLMDIAEREGNLELAYWYGCQALELSQQLENSGRIFIVNERLGDLAQRLGLTDEARNFFSVNLAACKRLGIKEAQQRYLERLEQLDQVTSSPD